MVFHACSPETEVGGADHSNAHPGFDVAECGGVGSPPFLTEELSDALEGVDCFWAQHAINGDDKGDEGAAMFMALAQIFCLLFVFRGDETFLRIFVDVSLGIEVLDADVKDGVLAADEEATDQQVATFGSGNCRGCVVGNVGGRWSGDGSEGVAGGARSVER